MRMAVTLGPSVAAATVGCSVTERIGTAYQTVTSVNALSLVLDRAQYDAGVGPCLSAADYGTVLRLDVLADQTAYEAFAAAAVARGVQSSLSVPVPDPRRPAALNFYASVPRAFESEQARAIAHLLARCMAALLPGAAAVVVPAAGADDLAVVRARRTRIDRALGLLMAGGLSRPQAFSVLVQRSRAEQRSVHAVVDELLASTDRTVAS